jgi:hypothetical protein
MPLEFTPLAGAGPDVAVLDPGGAPETIIDTDATFTIRVRWSVEEPGAAVLGGRWLVRAYAESIGPGQEEQLGQIRRVDVANFTPLTGPPAARGYEANVDVPAGTLDAESATSSGVYKLAVIVTHENPNGSPTELAGHTEGPVIQMRNP